MNIGVAPFVLCTLYGALNCVLRAGPGAVSVRRVAVAVTSVAVGMGPGKNEE